MKVLGIDPSSNLGVAFYDSATKESHAKVIHIKKIDKDTPYTVGKRLTLYMKEFHDFLRSLEVDVCVIETPAYGIRSNASVLINAIYGVILISLFTQDMITFQVSPSSLKKYTTGKGNARKAEMLKAVYRYWAFDTDDDNCADAYALARIGAALLNDAGYKTTVGQRDALKVIRKNNFVELERYNKTVIGSLQKPITEVKENE